ncbi:HlyD family secretion protein [Skermanella mucosa]|uniref:HlyD family efflux transporter periplasmic adaptor subunit n=1 Tax=Skermanella mucosa TaxID=1789672 RepID=UPI00192BDEFF|nr:HlyD family efflux transporter periplasmic adaptor subunit [Skermanella mucosa]UEM23515.1 HlyD family secretion protein [Skermanella mucosa]
MAPAKPPKPPKIQKPAKKRVSPKPAGKGAATRSRDDDRHPLKAATLLFSSPNPLFRAPVYVLFFTLLSMLIYSFFASKDTMVEAPLMLQRQAMVIQAVGGGLVEAVEAGENSTVFAGDPLATIQEKIRAATTPEQEAMQRQIADLQQQEREAAKEYDFRLGQLELDRLNLERRRATEQGAIDNRIRQIEIQLQITQRNRQGIDEDLANARQDLGVRQQLYAMRDIPQVELQRAQTRVSDLQRAQVNAESDIQNVRLALETARGERAQMAQTFSQSRLDNEIENLKSARQRDQALIRDRIDELTNRLLESRTLVPGVRYDGEKALYSSVVDGVVTAVHVQRGTIINPGMPMFTMVRNTAPLEAHVLIKNRDIGRIRRGQRVQIKYFAYPGEDYGVQNGIVADIAAKPDSQPGGQSMYQVKVALERETVTGLNGVTKPLEIGLEGTAEIKTGEKRLIEILFAPASRFFQKEE